MDSRDLVEMGFGNCTPLSIESKDSLIALLPPNWGV